MAPLSYLWAAASLLAVGLPALFLFSSGAAIPSGDLPVKRPAPLVAKLRRIAPPGRLTVVGELQPIRTAQATSRLRGTVASVRFRPGDRVLAGTVVAVIRSAELENRLARQQAGVRMAEADVQAREQERLQAEDFLARRRELARRDLIPRRDAEDAAGAWETAKAAAALARARLAQQQAMLAQAQALSGLTRVTAPVAGEVMGRAVEPGEAINEGGAVLTIGDTSQMKLTAQIPRSAAAGLRAGAVARISTAESAETTMRGQIRRLARLQGDLVQLDIVFDNRERLLRSGTPVEAWIEISEHDDSSRIPRAAVFAESVFDDDVGRDSGGAAGQESAADGTRAMRPLPQWRQ